MAAKVISKVDIDVKSVSNYCGRCYKFSVEKGKAYCTNCQEIIEREKESAWKLLEPTENNNGR